VITNSLTEFTQREVAELRHGNREKAYQSLMEADDPAMVPLLIAEFRRDEDAAFRNHLLMIIAKFRLPDTLSFFAERLFDDYWRIALDFLVAQGSPEAIAVLGSGRERRFAAQREADEFREWLDEAILQAKQGSPEWAGGRHI
jgi:succinate dehydrogenase flavin-adding protein (antitoxin of CptAB toxin-antitoxin module)